MKIRTKLTVFFTIILFFMVVLLTLWYQYRLYHILKIEGTKYLDLMPPGFPPGFLEENKFSNFPDVKSFKERFNKFTKRDKIAEILSNYIWIAIFDENLNIVIISKLANKFPLKDLQSILKKKYFITKLNLNKEYFNSIEPQFTPEYNFMTEMIFYPENGNYHFFCYGKTTKIKIGNENLYIVFILSVNKYVDYLKKTSLNALISILFLITVIMFVGLWFSRYSLSPINKLINDLNKISENDLARRIILNRDNKDEISAISYSINNLLTRIEKAFNMEKQFIRDVSHEFKTPISILQLNIDNISNNPHLTDDEIDKISSSLEVLYSLDVLIQKMLYLSLLESSTTQFDPKSINLYELLSSIMNNLQTITDLKNIKFLLNMDDQTINIIGDRELLYIALFNITENALKYTDKGQVTLSAQKKDHKTEIIIEDTGIGIAQDKIDKIFDKFFRIDPSRQDTKSFGIGLTITKRILDIHKAFIKIESIENVRTSFIIEFQE
ncbi:MAG: HAMP domain-containing histidine kinase [Spirochaetes bacterium]|nr:HAMP domain-containing histidine kinase [Spirochaetota bacterium]